MPIISLEKVALDKPLKDNIRIKSGNVSLLFNVIAGKQGDFWIHFVPGLNISGYGSTDQEAQDFLKVEIEVFCEDILGMPIQEREAFLSSLGFIKEKFQSKNFSKAYVDPDAKFQEFDQGTLEHRILKTAI